MRQFEYLTTLFGWYYSLKSRRNCRCRCRNFLWCYDQLLSQRDIVSSCNVVQKRLIAVSCICFTRRSRLQRNTSHGGVMATSRGVKCLVTTGSVAASSRVEIKRRRTDGRTIVSGCVAVQRERAARCVGSSGGVGVKRLLAVSHIRIACRVRIKRVTAECRIAADACAVEQRIRTVSRVFAAGIIVKRSKAIGRIVSSASVCE
jgi:hypothetical protein